jgi:hypothetical protein
MSPIVKGTHCNQILFRFGNDWVQSNTPLFVCSVNNVWIGGRQVLADGQLTTIDEANVLATAAQWQGKIMQFKVEQSAK